MPIEGACHCGRTRFEVSEAPSRVSTCTCSFCSKRGALWSYQPPAQFRLISSQDSVEYGRGPSRHHQCAVCGCGTYTESPEWVDGEPDYSQKKIGVNARLLDGVDVTALPIDVIDGKNLW